MYHPSSRLSFPNAVISGEISLLRMICLFLHGSLADSPRLFDRDRLHNSRTRQVHLIFLGNIQLMSHPGWVLSGTLIAETSLNTSQWQQAASTRGRRVHLHALLESMPQNSLTPASGFQLKPLFGSPLLLARIVLAVVLATLRV
jgi:hypothetical protein